MPSKKLLATTFVGLAMAQVDNTQPEGENPITTFNTEFLGHQVASNSCSHRDLGFTGQLAGKWYAVYGDTLWCAGGVSDPDQDTEGFHGMVRNALSELTDDPLKVNDLHLNQDQPVAHQNQLLPYNEAWGETNTFGFGGTSIVETVNGSGVGVLFYLVVSFFPSFPFFLFFLFFPPCPRITTPISGNPFF